MQEHDITHDTIFLIPSSYGGGAEKIFKLIEQNHNAKFMKMWDVTDGLIKSEIPESIIRRLLESCICAYRLRKIVLSEPQVRHLILFLPLGLLATILCPLQLNRIYCRRNDYPNRSLNRRIEKFCAWIINGYVFCAKQSALPTKKPSVIVRNPIPKVCPTSKIKARNLSANVMIVGRISKQKRPLLAAQIGCERSEKVFSFYGEGPLRSDLEEFSASCNNLIIAGHVPDPFGDNTSGILLHCSSYEGSPNVIYEAVANGRVVVCRADLSGLDDLPSEILQSHFCFVDNVASEDIAKWQCALDQADQKLQKIQKLDVVSRHMETDEQYVERFTSQLRSLVN